MLPWSGTLDAVLPFRPAVRVGVAEAAFDRVEAVAGRLVAGQRVGVRVEDQEALVAVDDDRVAAGDVGDELAQADDGGDLEHAGDDGRVAGPAAGLGGEGEDAAGVERRGRFAAGVRSWSQHDDGFGQVARAARAF